MALKDRIENEARGGHRITNEDLTCKNCKFKFEDNIRLGNTSRCEKYPEEKPDKVLVGGECTRKEEE